MKSSTLIQNIATQTLLIEQKALQKLTFSINEVFVETVFLISKITGRVVMTGVGKSALVAQKIVATFNSTGTPALFMHAADAVHGDLGMLAKDDVLLCISKSGETAEIKVLLPLVKQFGNPIIGLSSNADSLLAQQADYFIFIPVEKEADPNNLAPTTSTTAQMAMGDALAMSLLALKGFTPQDFSKFHPGGSLGKRLYLKVADVYIKNAKPQVQAKDNLKQVIVSMTSARLGMTVVVENDKPIGVITDGDLRRMLEKTMDLEGLTAENIMTQNPLTVLENDLAAQALSFLREKSITQLVVVNTENVYLGVIHLHDLVKEGVI